MTILRSGLRVDGEDVRGLRDSINNALSKLLGQDRRRYNVEPAHKPVLTTAASYSALEGDHHIRVDATGGARTITLPPAASVKGLVFTVKKIDASANGVTVDGNGAELIDGAATVTTTTQYAVYRLLSNGTGWDLL